MAGPTHPAPSGASEQNRDASDRRLRTIAVVGGGTAGWLAASMLARALTGTGTHISVIESADIGTVGVGEATIPPILDVLRFLGIDEADFIRHTQATYKLGIKFVDWKVVGHSYWHPFGTFGAPLNRRPFFHAWNRLRASGQPLRFQDYSLCAALGDAGRFRFPDPAADGAAAGLRYALHFDATLVAQYLRRYAEHLGVRRIENTVVGATRLSNGHIDALQFADQTSLSAELYLDCSGFRGLLIEEILGTGYLDWSAMLPCDRAVAFPSAPQVARPPYTQARARPAGWQWRIPLQHRFGNGYVYSSAYCSDEDARADLLATVGEPPVAEPRFLRFVTGRRRRYWTGNCVALGLASGFLEPLESTSIHLVTSGINHLLEHFPDRDFDPGNIDSYNAELTVEAERVRDFIVLHYCLTEREDSGLWRYCRAMPLPDSLAERIDRYRGTGRVRPRAGELFTDLSWFYILDGMGVVPHGVDPMLGVVTDDQLSQFMSGVARANEIAMLTARPHDSYFGPRSGPAVVASRAT